MNALIVPQWPLPKGVEQQHGFIQIVFVTHNQFDVAGSPVANMRDVPAKSFFKLDMLWIDFQ
ncbi:hypothetical protein MJL33_28125, partial [Salmonella enterica subsp. enterica serovar Kentucky]|nr:hypothetical protein [Salmonella enterica subsp. enterica serovar Kentucky]